MISKTGGLLKQVEFLLSYEGESPLSVGFYLDEAVLLDTMKMLSEVGDKGGTSRDYQAVTAEVVAKLIHNNNGSMLAYFAHQGILDWYHKNSRKKDG